MCEKCLNPFGRWQNQSSSNSISTHTFNSSVFYLLKLNFTTNPHLQDNTKRSDWHFCRRKSLTAMHNNNNNTPVCECQRNACWCAPQSCHYWLHPCSNLAWTIDQNHNINWTVVDCCSQFSCSIVAARSTHDCFFFFFCYCAFFWSTLSYNPLVYKLRSRSNEQSNFILGCHACTILDAKEQSHSLKVTNAK